MWPWLLVVLDQALVSGTRFLASIIVARACGPRELGTYAISLSALVLAGCFQEAIITTPYAVLSQRLRGRARAGYAGAATYMHVQASLFSAGLFVALALIGFALQANAIAAVLLTLAVTLPAFLLADFMRRLAIGHFEVRWAASLDALIAAVQLSGLLIVAQTGHLNGWVALLIVGASCLAAGIVGGLFFARPRIQAVRSTARYWKQGWEFGRWLMASQVVGAIHGMIPAWLLAVTVGTDAAGAFVAVFNLALLANPVLFAVGNLLTPRAARSLVEGGPERVLQVVFGAQRYLLLLTAIFAAVLAWDGERLIHWVYGESFVGLESAAGLLGLTAATWAVTATCASGLNAFGQQRLGFLATCAGVIVSTCSILLLAPHSTIVGTSFGLLMGCATAASLYMWALLRSARLLAPGRAPARNGICDRWLVSQDSTNA